MKALRSFETSGYVKLSITQPTSQKDKLLNIDSVEKSDVADASLLDGHCRQPTSNGPPMAAGLSVQQY